VTALTRAGVVIRSRQLLVVRKSALKDRADGMPFLLPLKALTAVRVVSTYACRLSANVLASARAF
jgi:hypothetical protein